MNDALCQLTLLLAPELEATLIGTLLELNPPLAGYTLLPAAGHGRDFAVASPRERVRGQVTRRALWLVLPRERVAGVLEALHAALHSRDVVYWITPVEDFGNLA